MTSLTDDEITAVRGFFSLLAANNLTGDALGKFLQQAGLLVQSQALTVAVAKIQAGKAAASSAADAQIAAINTQQSALQTKLAATVA